MLSTIGLLVTGIAFIGLMIAPSVAFIPGIGPAVSWIATNAWWLLPVGLFALVYGFSRNIILSFLIAVLAVFILKFVLGIAI